MEREETALDRLTRATWLHLDSARDHLKLLTFESDGAGALIKEVTELMAKVDALKH
jgi:hypothetical protein